MKSLSSFLLTTLCMIGIGFVGYFIGTRPWISDERKLAQHPGHQASFLFIRVEFPDHQMPALRSEWQYNMETLLKEASDYWSKQTYGTFKGFERSLISPILTLSKNADDYIEQHETLFQDAVIEAKKAGIDTGDFDHIAISYPKLTKADKAWGSPGRIWIPGKKPAAHQFIHEVGHSFGLGHTSVTSGRDPLLDLKVLPSDDPLFMMGARNFRYLPLPLPMRYQLDLLSDDHVPHLKAPGRYRVYACDQKTLPKNKAVGYRITTKNKKRLWLSYSPSLEKIFDSNNSEDYHRAIFLQLWNGLAVATLDATPNSYIYPGDDGFDSGIKIGTTFNVPQSNLTLKPIGIGKDHSGHPWIDLDVLAR